MKGGEAKRWAWGRREHGGERRRREIQIRWGLLVWDDTSEESRTGDLMSLLPHRALFLLFLPNGRPLQKVPFISSHLVSSRPIWALWNVLLFQHFPVNKPLLFSPWRVKYNHDAHTRGWKSSRDPLRLALRTSRMFGVVSQFALWPKTGERRWFSRVNEMNKLMEKQHLTCISFCKYTEKELGSDRVAGICSLNCTPVQILYFETDSIELEARNALLLTFFAAFPLTLPPPPPILISLPFSPAATDCSVSIWVQHPLPGRRRCLSISSCSRLADTSHPSCSDLPRCLTPTHILPHVNSSIPKRLASSLWFMLLFFPKGNMHCVFVILPACCVMIRLCCCWCCFFFLAPFRQSFVADRSAVT